MNGELAYHLTMVVLVILTAAILLLSIVRSITRIVMRIKRIEVREVTVYTNKHKPEKYRVIVFLTDDRWKIGIYNGDKLSVDPDTSCAWEHVQFWHYVVNSDKLRRSK